MSWNMVDIKLANSLGGLTVSIISHCYDPEDYDCLHNTCTSHLAHSSSSNLQSSSFWSTSSDDRLFNGTVDDHQPGRPNLST